MFLAQLTRFSFFVVEPQLTITERVSATAETAGHSILVTSFTDALAFLVGKCLVYLYLLADGATKMCSAFLLRFLVDVFILGIHVPRRCICKID